MLVMGIYITCLMLFLQSMPIEKVSVFNMGLGLAAIISQVIMLGYGRIIHYLKIQFYPEKVRLALFDRFLAPIIYLVAFQLSFHADPQDLFSGLPYLLAAVLVMQSSEDFRTGQWFWKYRSGRLEYYNDTGGTDNPMDIWRENSKYWLMVSGIMLFLIINWVRSFRAVEG